MAAVLPELPKPPARDMPAGPTPWSNWVIPGRVLAGAYPASMDDAETEHLLTVLLELGVTTFVCLQAEVNIHIPEHSWRAGMGLRPYIRDAQRLLSRAQEVGSTRISQRKIDFLHLPIIDGSVTTDSAMSRLADDCCERVLRGEKLYIHCWGGHGRTGTLVATMLGRLYDLPYSSALRYTQAYHDTRIYPQGVRSPQTAVQRAQVKRLLMLPNSFAGLVQTAPSSLGLVSPEVQRMVGSPTAVPAGAVSPATPIKQPVVPASLARTSIRSHTPVVSSVAGGAAAAAAAANLAVGSGVAAAAGSNGAVRGSSSLLGGLGVRRSLDQPRSPLRSVSSGSSGGGCSSSNNSRQSPLQLLMQPPLAAVASPGHHHGYPGFRRSSSARGDVQQQLSAGGSGALSASGPFGSNGALGGTGLLGTPGPRTPVAPRVPTLNSSLIRRSLTGERRS